MSDAHVGDLPRLRHLGRQAHFVTVSSGRLQFVLAGDGEGITCNTRAQGILRVRRFLKSSQVLR